MNNQHTQSFRDHSRYGLKIIGRFDKIICRHPECGKVPEKLKHPFGPVTHVCECKQRYCHTPSISNVLAKLHEQDVAKRASHTYFKENQSNLCHVT